MSGAAGGTTGTGPLTAAEAVGLLGPLDRAPGLVLAVSGGPDSIALMHLAAAVAVIARGAGAPFPRLIVGTVDHGLRAEAGLETEDVTRQAGNLGLEVHRLVWSGAKPDHGLQEAAREARYGLLVDLARRRGASHLATAHTQDDQAETVLFRLARGSGPAGLAGMRPRVARGGLVHVRPFLNISKARLVAACQAAGWSFHEDPSNTDTRFARARWRRLMPDLAAEGLGAERIATFARRMAQWDAALDAKAAAARRGSCVVWCAESRIYALDRLLEEPVAIMIRLLEQSLTDFAASGPPRLGRIEGLVEALVEAHAGRRAFRRSLHGALLSALPGGDLEITRAPARRRGLMTISRRLLPGEE